MTGEIFKDPDNDDLDNNGKDNKNIIANIMNYGVPKKSI
jgi:hypothetical protein